MEKVKKTSRSNKKELDTIQSNLSFSYLHAVVSRVGGSCESTGRTADNMGIDVTLMFQGQFSPRPVYQTIPIIGQLKSTRQPLHIVNGKISYSLCSKQYRKYTQSSTTEFLLFLFALPENPESWLQLTPQELILRKCCYWTSLAGAPPAIEESITIHIPEKNLFNVEQLRQILEMLSKGNRLKYDS